MTKITTSTSDTYPGESTIVASIFDLDLKDIEFDPEVPYPVYPPSMRDVDMHPYPGSMDVPMSDPCPKCGAFRMLTGDYMCIGACMICWNEAVAQEHDF